MKNVPFVNGAIFQALVRLYSLHWHIDTPQDIAGVVEADKVVAI